MYKQSRNVEVEMSRGLVMEPVSAGYTPNTYYNSANNNRVKYECDLGQLATFGGERREEESSSCGSSTSMNSDWTVNKFILYCNRINTSAQCQTDPRYIVVQIMIKRA